MASLRGLTLPTIPGQRQGVVDVRCPSGLLSLLPANLSQASNLLCGALSPARTQA